MGVLQTNKSKYCHGEKGRMLVVTTGKDEGSYEKVGSENYGEVPIFSGKRSLVRAIIVDT